MFNKKRLLVAAVSIMFVAAGCSSSSKPSSSSSNTNSTSSNTNSTSSNTNSSTGSSGTPTYTVGVITDLTGPGANATLTNPIGIRAGVSAAAAQGYKIKYVVADTGSTPTGALTAAERLVEQDHVFAILADSFLFFGAAHFLASKNIPVIGAAVDSNEWITDSNMFSVIGTQDYNKVYSQYGLTFKQLGVTDVGTIGYNIGSSALTAKGAAASAQAAGIKVGYVNANLPFGTTNVEPIAFAMKSAGVNGLTTGVDSNTSFALVKALQQLGVNLKGALMVTGYGADLTSGGPGATQLAQGLYFLVSNEPIEMHTAATQQFANALKTAGIIGDPGFSETLGYLSVEAFVDGLKAAGPNPTQASLIHAMDGITNFNGAGLYGTHSVSWVMSQRGQVSSADNCWWVVQYSGSTFHLVPGLDPVCGQTLAGKKV
jgi:branched-chain amino acid transport system substrate-binding protein